MKHRNQLIALFKKRFTEKYDKGQAEHGGELWNKNTSTMMLEEVMDQWSYAVVAWEQRLEAIVLLEREMVARGLSDTVLRALKILKGTGEKK